MEVQIENSQSRHKISLGKIRQKAEIILNALGCPDGELSILIVDDSRISELNSKYLHRQGPTNVIAFPMNEGNYKEITPQLLGDIVISAETAEKEGNIAGISGEYRITQLLIHGILHLFNYDHEKTEQEAYDMEKKSNEMLKLVE
jgi:probable rRNA maturation factor